MIHGRKDYDRIQDPKEEIAVDEPVFLLRAQDKLFIPMLREYIMKTRAVNGSSEIIKNLLAHIKTAQQWQNKNVPKRADLKED